MNQTFLGLAATYFENLTDMTGALPERVEARKTSPRFFAVLGMPAALGRTASPEEEIFGGPRVVVLSDAFWRKRFEGNPLAIGRTLTLGSADYDHRRDAAVVPLSDRDDGSLAADPGTERVSPSSPGASVHSHRAAETWRDAGTGSGRPKRRGSAARQGVPQTDAGWGAAVVPLKEEQIGGVRRSLWLLLGAVALVLLAAFGNVACLMLAEAPPRSGRAGAGHDLPQQSRRARDPESLQRDQRHRKGKDCLHGRSARPRRRP